MQLTDGDRFERWMKDEVTSNFLEYLLTTLADIRYDEQHLMQMTQEDVLKAVGVNAACRDVEETVNKFIEERGNPAPDVDEGELSYDGDEEGNDLH